ncbi:bifunctional DNA-formamidopyrimidine glycosylase/DNA-(apurinic or apyrimidinic site) lyase [Lysobacter ciconiae]|uniref:Formamidopyrimidine-DNA glycosylase n=1 Tax=Novilysobacter ciconiae TaxID=2781022 RepID=A0A7S6ZSI3_9GAMM|nr:bifunctional DNA-formamidopyrimidine glycosylase/DNA-(apurinic or apyrimidinic site) lyase [Lysobacter ciconiae]QOW19729.1 bifunctional DNA-formamidopyrimidine glycosylase/DNA-(apurinic or apyrimidinic site) lyase [Lysobacter ciconiae]
MPELPEVETTRAALAPHLTGRTVIAATLRRTDLRWPIAAEISTLLPRQRILGVRRRAKYLLLDTAVGSALLHLGMSGSLRVIPAHTPPRPHDHVDLLLDNERVLRMHDPRRFGSVLWQAPGSVHPLLASLGPEPLSDAFTGDYLYALGRGRRAPVKAFLMDQAVVVGVGNIYAAEALFAAGISPLRAAGRISRERYRLLAGEIRRVLEAAIAQGGTTLRDFISPDGNTGYFVQQLSVYGQGGAPCPSCGRALKQASIGQRTSVWCSNCQR